MAAIDDLGEVRQRREALLDALAGVEAALAAPAFDVRWRDGVGDALSSLHTTLEQHAAATEAPDGFLNQVRDDAPRLSNQVNRLAAEHAALIADSERLLDRLARAPSAQVMEEIADVREQAIDLLAAIVRHRQRGADLIYEAYNVDVGGPG